MFSSSTASRRDGLSHARSFSRSHRASKPNASFTSSGVKKRRHESRHRDHARRPSMATTADDTVMITSTLISAIVTIVVGHEQRIFAAHEDVLCISPFFAAAIRGPGGSSAIAPGALPPASPASPGAAAGRRIALPDEEPEIFSSVLEYLYKGDYYPPLVHNKRRNSWELDVGGSSSDRAGEGGGVEPAVCLRGAESDLLKDTVIYCAADKYGLEELKRVALRKQGLRSGIQCSTILASARYAYAHTPDSDSKLRAHYLALIIRSRGTFKRSGTMQLEMFSGGTPLFFDLFVALCNHVDDVSAAQTTPRRNRFF